MKHVPSLEPVTLAVPLETCDRCGKPALLLARLGPDRHCVTCWKKLPEPRRWPGPATREQVQEAEVAARERMTARGGADAHIVRKGLS